ncbi:hypothetical protein K4L44_02830 [Halosquirtibacter laminarini]|uniref:Uncharacterized protein n=1 Tax=Halosquirtibacter laminarini TaxID=3374600 RepID=A0AC61NGY8_9BACT|nr:hypothetical protein K4L44_02830 [Prolixibacteraceae bacterium]
MKSYVLQITLVILTLTKTTVFAHQPILPLIESTHINKYEYGACNHNFSIATNNNGSIFLANDMGLVVYNGSTWKLYQMPNKVRLQQVFVSKDNKVYCATDKEVGVWREKRGTYHYTPIKQFKQKGISSFCSSKDETIYFNHQNQTYKIIGLKLSPCLISISSIELLFEDNGYITDCSTEESYYDLTITQVKQFKSDINLKDILKIITIGDKRHLFLTSKQQIFYQEKNNEPQRWDTEIAKILSNKKIIKIRKIEDLIFFLTQHNGLYVLDIKTQNYNHINQRNYLTTDKVTDFVVDNKNRVYISTLDGISILQLDARKQRFTLPPHVGSETYCIRPYGKYFIIGTERGLFYTKKDQIFNNRIITSCKPFSTLQKRVWSITDTDEGLVCALDNGTYLINKDLKTHKISTLGHGVNFIPVHFKGHTQSYWLQNTGDAIYLYQTPLTKHKPILYAQTPHINKSLAIYEGYLWASSMGKYYVYRVPLQYPDKHPHKAEIVKKFSHILPTNVMVLDSELNILSDEGTFLYDNLNDTIKKFSGLEHQIGEYAASSNLFKIRDFTYWYVTRHKIAAIRRDGNHFTKISEYFFNDPQQSLIEEFEYIEPINRKQSLVCIQNGFTIVYDDFDSKIPKSTISIKDIAVDFESDETTKFIHQENITPTFQCNAQKISFTIISNKSPKHILTTEYRLNRNENNWTKFDYHSPLVFRNLKPGDYELEIRSWDENRVAQGSASFKFKIDTMWYDNILFIISFITILSLSIISLALYYIWKYNKKRIRILTLQNEHIRHKENQRRLEKEKEFIKQQNKALHEALDKKSRDLVLFAMERFNNRELLEECRERFIHIKKELKYRFPDKYYVNNLTFLEENIKECSNKEELRKFIDEQNREYIHHIQEQYPTLTDKELRIIVLTKMNFTNKQITIFFHKSTHSVEQLKKNIKSKMNIPSSSKLRNALPDYNHSFSID